MTQKDLLKKLLEVLIRFNTSPKLYLKEDYLVLYQIIEELANLHDTRIVELKNNWDEVVASNTLPDGILIKNTIRSILEKLVSIIISLEDVAKEETSLEILTAIENIDIDLTSVEEKIDEVDEKDRKFGKVVYRPESEPAWDNWTQEQWQEWQDEYNPHPAPEPPENEIENI